MRRTGIAVGAALLVAVAAAAHPGHGLAGGSWSWVHYATDPLHVAPVAVLALALLVGWRRRRVGRARRR